MLKHLQYTIALLIQYCTISFNLAQTVKNGSAIFYLDSGSNHYLQLDSIGFKKETQYRVREFYRDALLSSGKTNWRPDAFTLQQIKWYSIRTYQNYWYDTILLFNFFGDTLQYAYRGDINKTFDIHYSNNHRTEFEQFGKHRIASHWVKDGLIEKHYKHKRLHKIVLRPYNGKARTFYYQRYNSLTYFYSPDEDLYASFRTETEDMKSVYPNFSSIATKVKNRQYLLVYPSDYRTRNERSWRLYQSHAFPKKQYRLLYRKLGRHGRRYDLEQLIDSKDSLPASNTISAYNTKGQLIYYRLEQLTPDTSFYELGFKSRIGKRIYRYNSDYYHGHIYFKRHRFKHTDTIINRGKTYISKGEFKHHFYYFTTYCNQKVYRHGKIRLYYNYSRPKSLSGYSDNQYKLTIMEDLYPYIHNLICADVDTFFLGDTTLIFGHHTIAMRTADKTTLLFDSIYDVNNRIVKDQAQCAVGLKTLEDKWLIPPNYDHIDRFQLPGNNATVYFASVNDYGALYNHKGQVMIPPTRGLSSVTMPLSFFYTSALDIINQYAFICNDLTTDSFKLIDQFNRVVLQGSGKYNYYHQKPGIKHQGKITFNYLNTGNNKHWFKDTIVFIGRDEALLWELQPNAQGRQLRLLNTATNQLEPDTFCLFYNKQNEIGIESDKRRIYYSNGLKHLIDSQLLAVESFYASSDYLILKNGEKYGLAEDNKIILSPEYDAIRIGGSVHVAFKDSVMYFIDYKTGAIIKNMGYQGLSTKSPKGVSEFPNFEISFKNFSVIEIKKDNKLGLVDHTGNEILPCTYNYISSRYEFSNAEVDNSEGYIETLDQDSVLQTWHFVNDRLVKTYPKTPMIYIDYDNYHHYMGFSGQKHRYKFDLIEPNSSQINTDIITYNCYQMVDTAHLVNPKYVSYNGARPGTKKLIGILDEKLNWIMRFDTFENIQDLKTFFYFMTKDKRCGVMDRNFTTIIPAQYHRISYDPERHWLWHKNKHQSYWQLTNLQLDTCISDSIDYPIHIATNEENGVIARNGFYGLINTIGKIIVTPEYERISELTQSQTPRVFLKNNAYYTQNYYHLYQQAYDKLYMPEWAIRNENSSHQLIGSRGPTTYIVSYFNTIDSSKHLYIDKDPSTLAYNRNYLTKLNKEYASTSEIFQHKIRIFYLIEQSAIERRFYWHSPTPAAAFPDIRTEGATQSSSVFSGTIETWAPVSIPKDSFKAYNKAPYIEPDYRLKFEDFAGLRYQFVSEGKNTMTYRGKNYMHLVFDSSSVYKFTLIDIIDPAKKDTLNNYLHKLWLKQDNPNLACVPVNQIFDLFKDNFYMNGPYFWFMPRQLDMSVTIEDMKPFMTAEWAKRF